MGLHFALALFAPFHTKSDSPHGAEGQNSASALDIFNLLITIGEMLRQVVLTCCIDSSTSGNPTPREVINDVAVLSPLPDISIVNI